MPKLLIHGGAGTIAAARRPAYLRGLTAALAAGWATLDAGGDAVEAVLRAVETMEANPDAFNAGVGGSPNRDGEVELDACVVRGEDGSVGAVAGVRRTAAVARLADRVRRETPHVLLAGAGADALVADPVEPSTLLTDYSRSQWARWRNGRGADDAVGQGGGSPAPTGSATVGAVALDALGDLAAATSTGGVLGKWPGRVGDTPIVGAGTYADRAVAVSATGKGEAFLRAVTAKALADRLEAGETLDAALGRALADVRRMAGSGGLIVVTADGRLGYAFDTTNLAVAWTDGRSAVADVLDEAGVVVIEAHAGS